MSAFWACRLGWRFFAWDLRRVFRYGLLHTDAVDEIKARQAPDAVWRQVFALAMTGIGIPRPVLRAAAGTTSKMR